MSGHLFPAPLWFGEMCIFSWFFVAVVTLASGCCSEMVKSKALDTLSLINNMPMKVQGSGLFVGLPAQVCPYVHLGTSVDAVLGCFTVWHISI